MARNFLFCVFCMLYLGRTTATVVRSCEGNSLSLSCTSGFVISINRANYGRTTGSETCPHPMILVTECYASNSKAIARELCNGQASCTLYATNDAFGDPCVGTYKYLEVDYTCRRSNSIVVEEPTCVDGVECKTKRACEGGALSLSCYSGSVINIIKANYGRTNGQEACPHKRIQTTSCFASGSANAMRNLCNGQTSCTVPATNSIFGDPCVGTYKYLEATYTCEDGPETKRICEGGALSLSCPAESPTIFISNAMYGRQAPGSQICPHRSIQTTNCAASNSLDTVRSTCQGQSDCTLAASNRIFGDPCTGTYKYLEVGYTCARRVRACERNAVQIVCPSGQKIEILDALYGRMEGGDVCPHLFVFNQNCRASSSMRIVKDRCNGLTTCTVAASNSIFGQPCLGTFKYLEVLYDCKQ
ncbi:rhamnose-binding lectin-like [Lytechinus pictus]|uniref:rhamnose-binding lectin-like n=1 Tax=Lytechinus pictus TaxID=7653 RepID=UPI0030B9B8CD